MADQKLSDILFSQKQRTLRNLIKLKELIKKVKKERRMTWVQIAEKVGVNHCDLVRFVNNDEKGIRGERLKRIEEWLFDERD